MIMTCRIHTQQGLGCNVAGSPAKGTEWTLWIKGGNAFCLYRQEYQPKINQLSDTVRSSDSPSMLSINAISFPVLSAESCSFRA